MTPRIEPGINKKPIPGKALCKSGSNTTPAPVAIDPTARLEEILILSLRQVYNYPN
jgi:hypothetical protein